MMSINLAKMAKKSPLFERSLVALALAVGGFLLLRAIFTLLEPSRAYKAPQIRPQLAAQSSQSTNIGGQNLNINPRFDPFHRLIDEAGGVTPQVEIGEDAPETDLNITLKGRRASGDGSGSAVLSLPDGQENNFKQGETIFKDVVLEAVYSTHIIISRKGTQERVTFERTNGLITQTAAAAAKTPAANPAPQPAAARIDNNSAPISPLDLEHRNRVTNQRAEKAKKRNSKTFTSRGVAAPLAALQPSPVRKNGQFIGYRLRGAEQSDELGLFGLQSDDIVTQINGQNLPQQPTKLTGLIEQLSQDFAGATLTIDRDGQILTLSVN